MAEIQKSPKAAQYHDRLATSFQFTVVVLVPVMAIICGFLARQRIFDPNFYSNDAVYIGLSLAYAATSAFYFFFRSRRHLTKLVNFVFITALNVITLLYTLLLTGFVNVFLVAWVPLMVSSDLLFGRLGLLFSFLALTLSGILTAVMHPNLNDPLYLIVLTQEVLGLGVMAVVIAAIRRIAESEGRALFRVSAQEDLQRERLLSLINSMADAVVSTDDRGEIKIYNASFLSLLDTNADVTNQNIDAILQLRDRQQKSLSIIEEAQSIRKVFSRTDLTHTFTGGESIRLYINVAPIRPGYQSINERGFIIVLRDITKEKTLDEERDEFISVVSHELRTPIAVAEGNLANLQLLKRQGASEETIKKVVDDAHEHIVYLAKIINDLGTLTRAEQGSDIILEEINIKELLRELYTTYAPQVQQKGLRLELDIAPQLKTVQTSREYLLEILNNLITNAIKYTTDGSITIAAHTIDNALTISVKDTGIGIGKSDRAHIFEKFYRSEDYRTRESGGTGLGLYISAKLASRLGYALEFESRLNHGSTFRLVMTSILRK